MNTLRQRMHDDMRIRNLAVITQEQYIISVAAFAKHFGKSPDNLGPEDIRTYQNLQPSPHRDEGRQGHLHMEELQGKWPAADHDP